jgi:CheY-like chemotaxis protein
MQKFARIRQDEPFVPMDVKQVIRDSLAITRPRWEEKKVKGGVPLQLELELGPVPVVMGRPAELNEVITNLVLNAIDAMPRGGTLRLRTRLADHRHASITVSDTGVGMSEEVRRRVFDPFFTTKGEEGTGLGLSVSHSIVERHGGDLRVDSRPGEGTTFTITLPIGMKPTDEDSAGTETRGERKGRILLVDNDPQVLSILGEMLKDSGHHVLPVPSGPEALRVFVPSGFDLVITNVGMPEMNGWDVADRLRARDPNVPVIFVTGWGLQEEDQARCRRLGISALLFKPVPPQELHRTVQVALAARTR